MDDRIGLQRFFRFKGEEAMLSKIRESIGFKFEPYVVFKPLKDVDPSVETPSVVVFLASPEELSALVVLANYSRKGVENVIVPFGAGCQTIGIFPYKEAASENPRAVVGLTDISARLYLKKHLGSDVMSFAVPWKMFLEMEGNVSGSFLDRKTWKRLRGGESS
jgi:hypothetical protein